MIGPLIASGREADVYALDDARVLRRYRRETDVTGEVDAMRYLAGAGYPVPVVHEAAGSDMVLERLDGPTMAEALSTGALPLGEGAQLLADLHRRLHELPPWPGSAPGTRIVHLDLHPENVLITARGPVVIDWCNARPGDPEFDLAMTALILAEVSLSAHPMADVAGAFLAGFLTVAPGDPRRRLAEAVAHRQAHSADFTPQEVATIGTAAELLRR